MIKSYKLFESEMNFELEINDICQDLKDLGLKVDIIPEKLNKSNKYIVVSHKKPWIGSNWDELKEYALRLKDYLGNRFLIFKYRNIPQKINGPRVVESGTPYYKEVLNDRLEIKRMITSFAIKYKV